MVASKSGVQCIIEPSILFLHFINLCFTTTAICSKTICYIAKSRKYQGVFEVKSRVRTWQVRGIWSQQLEHKQVPKWGWAEPGVRRGKRSLLACRTRCKCSIETIHNSVKVKVGTKVMKVVESLNGLEVTVGQR